MSDDDQAAFPEPDLSIPLGSLDDSIWQRLLSDAFDMSPADLDASIVPDFNETEEIELTDDEFDAASLDDDLLDLDDDSVDAFPADSLFTSNAELDDFENFENHEQLDFGDSGDGNDDFTLGFE